MCVGSGIGWTVFAIATNTDLDAAASDLSVIPAECYFLHGTARIYHHDGDCASWGTRRIVSRNDRTGIDFVSCSMDFG